MNHQKPTLIGILNVTPDSFSDGGIYFSLDAALSHGEKLIKDGADIIEIGGESTRPGSSPITEDEEIKRVLPVVQALAPLTTVSVDTFRANTAKQCLEAGAKIINDVSALRFNPELASVIADFDAKVILMHSKESGQSPHASEGKKEYKDVVKEIADFLLTQSELALLAGVKKENIILDPGMGRFISENPNYSWEVLRRFDELVSLTAPYPCLVSTSRKGFLGGPLEKRDITSQLTSLWAYEKGAKYIRVHNIDMARQCLFALEELRKIN